MYVIRFTYSYTATLAICVCLQHERSTLLLCSHLLTSLGTIVGSLDGVLVNGNEDREEYKLSLSKNYDNWNFGYSSTYDLSDDNTEQINEEISIDYTEEYMFQNCLNIKLSYKNNGGSVDRDIKPENSIFLTFSFRNLGDYDYKAPSLF